MKQIKANITGLFLKVKADLNIMGLDSISNNVNGCGH
jgi:hypothetical protein